MKNPGGCIIKAITALAIQQIIHKVLPASFINNLLQEAVWEAIQHSAADIFMVSGSQRLSDIA